MKTLKLKANAKINLSLDITGQREDGYHLMDMVMQSVTLRDTVEISTGCDFEGIRIQAGKRYLPSDERNTAYKAAVRLGEAAGFTPSGISISIQKSIPTRAGLGGGSADAAAVLVGLNRLLGLGKSLEELAEVGEKVGADVPFCVIGGTARVSGIGEIVRKATPIPECGIVILMPRVGNSTPELFSKIDSAGPSLKHPNVDKCELALATDSPAGVAGSMGNIFELVGDPAETNRLKKLLTDNGALGACMSGSGAAVFGIFETAGEASACASLLRAPAQQAFAVHPVSCGVSL